MRRGLIVLATALLALLIAHGARAQAVVFANSDPEVAIHSTFTGQTITLFGNIEPDADEDRVEGPFDVIVLVRGPALSRVVRMMDRQFGVMVNTDAAMFEHLPGYYAVLSSAPLSAILDPDALDDPRLSLEGIAETTLIAGRPEPFVPQVVRLMTERGLFARDPRGVTFLSPTTFTARAVLPAHIPNGTFVAQALVIKDREIVAQRTTWFAVRTEGFEQFVSETATQLPLLYGLITVLVALVTGWLGGVLFRR